MRLLNAKGGLGLAQFRAILGASKSLGSLLACIRSLTREPFCPVMARFSYPAPQHLETYCAIFRCPLRFSAPRSELEILNIDLRRTLLTADRGLQPILQQRAEDRIRALTQHARMDDLVRACLRSLPQGRRAAAPEVARALGVSSRTLARRLADEQASFQRLQDEHLRETCCRLLSQSGYTIEEVAFLAGYSDLSAFYRAFKSWTRRTPAEYRRATAGASHDPITSQAASEL